MTFCKALCALLLAALPLAATGGPTVRIDGSSDEAANASFQRMARALPSERQLQLMAAMVQLNLAGTESAREVVSNPDLQHPSAARIRARIAGLSAAEIIDLAHRTSDLRVSFGNDEPGVPAGLLRALATGDPPESLADTIWTITADLNGHVRTEVYAFHADHTATLMDTDRASPDVHRWEQSGNELRLSVNDGYAVMLGTLDGVGHARGEAGNRMGFRWTWTAARR